ncbi:MAG: hypothetical protein Ta2B_30530 [Termitinemataceae bacterium]|nr:MAG: hypothetical protein Ta2B_30530 [Termitinemataceae bacterium]
MILERKPLAATDPSVLSQFSETLKAELNLKSITFVSTDDVKKEDYGISEKLDVNARALGPRIGKRVQDVIKSAKAGQWHLADGNPIAKLSDGTIAHVDGEYSLNVVVSSIEDSSDSSCLTEAAAVLPNSGFVVLDLALTQDLINEGIARDIIREIQEARKNAGFEVSDRIHLEFSGSQEQAAAVKQFENLIQSETLSDDVTILDISQFKITVTKV